MAENPTLTTPEAMLSYPHFFTPQKNDKGEDAYTGALVFLPEAQQTDAFKAMVEAAIAAGQAKWPKDFEKLRKSDSFKWPFRKDWEAKGYPEGSCYINVRSKEAPGIVGREADPVTKKARIITDPKEIYPGVIVRATVRCFAFDNVSKGVSFGLRNIQKLADGPRLDNRKSATEEFEALAAAAAPADIQNLY